MEQKDLAIVILAYRGALLHRALSSLQIQKDKHFRVYVCDDASPEDIALSLNDFEDSLDIVYTRFEENFGIRRQGAHLERCLSLVRDETLVCFFSDDNELTRDAVQRIRKAAKRHPEINVFHLNTAFIDASSVRTGEGKRYCRKMKPAPLFRRIFCKEAPASLSSFFFRKEALGKAMFQIRDVSRSPLTLVFSAMGTDGVLLTPCRARLLKRPHASEYASNPATTLEKALQLQSFFGWSEYFFEGKYPLSPRDRVELFARHAASMYPARTEEEILAKFLGFRVFEREFGKGRGKRILHRSLVK